MKVAIIRNRDVSGVINTLGIQNKEFYNEKTVSMVAASLERNGHNVSVLDGNMYIIERLQNVMPRVMGGEQMGMVFNMAYGIQGESRYTHIPSMLEMLGIPYIGSGPAGHALALDKVMTKMVWQSANLPTPTFWVFSTSDTPMDDVVFPVIVKPKMESVSFGLKVVHDRQSLREAIDHIVTEFAQPAMVERFIRGREFCVGLLGNTDLEAFPVLEIDLQGNPDAIQTCDDKKHTPRKKICPAPIDEDLSRRMKDLSKRAFNALNLRDFARVDIRLDTTGGIHLLEINSMASLGPNGSYPYSANAAGYDYNALVNKILDVATLRYFSSWSPSTETPQTRSRKIPLHNRLRTFLRGRQSQLETLLKKLINTSTYQKDTASINVAARLITSELTALGFHSEVQPHLEAGNQYFFCNSTDKSLDILFLANLDNKVAIPDQHPYREEEHRLFGTGVWENKGGIVCLIGALQALRFTRNLKKKKIGIILVTDSTLNGRFSRTLIEQKSQLSHRLLGFQGAEKNGGLITSRSGAASYHFNLSLRESASSNDITRVSRYFVKTIASVLEISRNDPEELVAPYNMRFESNLFRGQAFGSVRFSGRFNTLDKFAQTDKKVREVATLPASLRKTVEISLHGGLNRPPLIHTPNDKRLFDTLAEKSKKLDQRILSEHRWSSSDICVVNDSLQRIDGLGPAGGFDMNREYIIRQSLLDKALLVAYLLASEP